MPFDRSMLREPADYYADTAGLLLKGLGKWRTARCDFHDGSDSMRVHAQTGAFVCMSCGVKGGDILSFHMQRHGLEFVDACKALGAWIDSDKPARHAQKPLPFSARSALEVMRAECLLVAVAACNLARGAQLASADRDRLVKAAGRIEFIASEIAK